MTTPPPGEGDPAENEPPPRPPWAWEPNLSSPAAAEPGPAPESGLEMLERLRERGLISQEEYEQRRLAIPAAPPPVSPDPSQEPPPAPSFDPLVPPPPPGDEAPAVPGAIVPPPPPPLPPTWNPPLSATPAAREPYPMRYDVAYPDGLSRGSTFIRGLLLIPVAIFGGLLQYFAYIAVFVGFTTVFWRKKYPDWLFRGLSGAFGFGARSYAYGLLLTDKFPSFSPEDSPVTLEYDQPPSGYLSRWRVLFWKSILLIPHFIVLNFLFLAVVAVSVIAWFAILLTGNYPRGLFQFTVGVQRWWLRVLGYFVSFNDRFPPFALSADAGPASNGATVANGIIGGVVAGGYAALIIAVVAIQGDVETVDADYAALQAGRVQYTTRLRDVFDEEEAVVLRLTRAVDPGDELIEVIRPAPSERVVVFQWTVVNGGSQDALIARDAARLKVTYEDDDDERTKSIDPTIIGVNNVAAPARVRAGGTATVQAVFVVPSDAVALELRFSGGFANAGVKYVFD